MNEVENVYRTGANVGKHAMDGVGCDYVRLLEEVGGGKVFVRAGDKIKAPFNNWA